MKYFRENFPISWGIEFVKKFQDEIKNKNQLQKSLGYLSYVSYYIPNIRIIAKPLFNRLQKAQNLGPQKY